MYPWVLTDERPEEVTDMEDPEGEGRCPNT